MCCVMTYLRQWIKVLGMIRVLVASKKWSILTSMTDQLVSIVVKFGYYSSRCIFCGPCLLIHLTCVEIFEKLYVENQSSIENWMIIIEKNGLSKGNMLSQFIQKTQFVIENQYWFKFHKGNIRKVAMGFDVQNKVRHCWYDNECKSEKSYYMICYLKVFSIQWYWVSWKVCRTIQWTIIC